MSHGQLSRQSSECRPLGDGQATLCEAVGVCRASADCAALPAEAGTPCQAGTGTCDGQGACVVPGKSALSQPVDGVELEARAASIGFLVASACRCSAAL